MRHLAKGLVAIYLMGGFAIAATNYYGELNTVHCEYAGFPDGRTIGSSGFANPDPENCKRRAFTARSLRDTGILMVAGVPLVCAQLLRRGPPT